MSSVTVSCGGLARTRCSQHPYRFLSPGKVLLQNNGLVGSLPTELGQLTAVSTLTVAVNDLTGTLPTELGGMSALSECC